MSEKVKMTNKVLFAVLCVLLAATVGLLFAPCAIGAAADEEPVIAKSFDEVTTLQMRSGATLRLEDLVDESGAKKGNGITWTLEIDESEYKSLQAKYTDLVFGVLVAPWERHYMKPVTYESVFGVENAYTPIASTDNTDGPDPAQIYVLNLRTGGLAKESNGNKMVFRASMTDIKPENVAREFVGIGYVRGVDGGREAHKTLAENDNIRSAAYLARELDADGSYAAQKSVFDKYMSDVGSLVAGYSDSSVYMLVYDNGSPKVEDFLGTNENNAYGKLSLVHENSGGITGDWLRYENAGSNKGEFDICVRPTYAKSYYETLLTSYPNSYVGFDSYFEAANAVGVSVFGTSETHANNVWKYNSVSLQTYINKYDAMTMRSGFGWDNFANTAVIYYHKGDSPQNPSKVYLGRLCLYTNAPNDTADKRITVEAGRAEDVNVFDELSLAGTATDYEYYIKNGSNVEKLAGCNVSSLSEGGEKNVYVVETNDDGTKTFIKTLAITYRVAETPSRFADRINGYEKAADFTQGAYTEKTGHTYDSGVEQTYIMKQHNEWVWKSNAQNTVIETKTFDGTERTYVGLECDGNMNYFQNRPIYIPNTVDIALLREFASLGYTLKTKVYVDGTNCGDINIYSLEYDSEKGRFKKPADVSADRHVTVSEKQVAEVEINLADYIRRMETDGPLFNGNASNPGSAEEAVGLWVLLINCKNGDRIYFSEPYFVAPDGETKTIVSEGDTVDLSEYNGKEVYTLINGKLAPVSGASYTVGDKDFSLVAMNKPDAFTRTFASVKSYNVLTAAGLAAAKAEFLETVNRNMSVANYAEDDYYQKVQDDTGKTYFAEKHVNPSGRVWYDANNPAEILKNTTVEGKTGNFIHMYAPNAPASGQTVPLFLPHGAMTAQDILKYAAMGYKLKIDIYLENPEATNVSVFAVQKGQFLYNSTRKTIANALTWHEVEIDINDYIDECAVEGNAVASDPWQNLCVGVQVRGKWDFYVSEPYLELASNETALNKSEGDTISLSELKTNPTDEVYVVENGVFREVTSDITVGASDFRIVTVSVNGYERTIGKVRDVSVS